jgi:hypothetical protein
MQAQCKDDPKLFTGALTGIEDHREGASGAVQQRAADLASITFVGSRGSP